MKEKEDKGFVVRDRRKVSLDDAGSETGGAPETKDEIGAEEARAREQFDKAASQGGSEYGHPLPEVTFATFVFSLSSSALVHLGEIPEPETSRTNVDLVLAKQIIDTLGMLQEKTKGNLEPDEDRLMKSLLYDLRLRYVQKSNS